MFVESVGVTIYTVNQRLYTIYNSCRTNHRQLLFRRHVNDDSKYYVYTVSDKRKDNKFSRLGIVLTSDANWKEGEGRGKDKP